MSISPKLPEPPDSSSLREYGSCGTKPFYLFGRFLIKIFFRVYHRVELRGMEHLPDVGGVLIVPTHTSFLDPPLAGSFLKREVYLLSRHNLLEIPIFGWILKNLNAIPLKQGGSDREALNLCRSILKAGCPLIFFPEGKRSVDGRLGSIQGGFALILSSLPDVPYMPVVMQETYHAFRRGWIFPRPRKIRVWYGPPKRLPEREAGERARDYYNRCTAQLREDWMQLGAR
jgi:1-acyl-sn-glycerol-3-phosphate acyltransferase